MLNHLVGSDHLVGSQSRLDPEPFRRRAACFSAVLFVCFANLTFACQSGDVGAPCIPTEEYAAEFPGFAIAEANVESGSFECQSRICLVNHFQGRVTCPYGQAESQLSQAGTAPERCRLPGSSGAEPSDQVQVPVEGWDLDRPAADTVYCSCRCDGPDPDARYCECPAGFNCTEIVPDFGHGKEQLIGSYCIRNGTRFSRHTMGGPTCQTNPEHPACPGEPGVNP